MSIVHSFDINYIGLFDKLKEFTLKIFLKKYPTIDLKATLKDDFNIYITSS